MRYLLEHPIHWLILIAMLVMATSVVAQTQDLKSSDKLKGRTIAILVANGFEESELFEPKKALEAAGAKTIIISPEREQVKAWKDKNWGKEIAVDGALSMAKAEQYDALLLPGGVMNPDTLRMNADAIKFIKGFAAKGKPIAAICHGPWTLVEADLVLGRKLTSWPSLKTDIRNAGGSWSDEEVVVDNNLITSRKPADIPAFNLAIIEVFSKVSK